VWKFPCSWTICVGSRLAHPCCVQFSLFFSRRNAKFRSMNPDAIAIRLKSYYMASVRSLWGRPKRLPTLSHPLRYHQVKYKLRISLHLFAWAMCKSASSGTGAVCLRHSYFSLGRCRHCRLNSPDQPADDEYLFRQLAVPQCSWSLARVRRFLKLQNVLPPIAERFRRPPFFQTHTDRLERPGLQWAIFAAVSRARIILRSDLESWPPFGDSARQCRMEIAKNRYFIGSKPQTNGTVLCGDGRFGGTRTSGSYRNGQEVRPPVEFRARSDRPEKRETRTAPTSIKATSANSEIAGRRTPGRDTSDATKNSIQRSLRRTRRTSLFETPLYECGQERKIWWSLDVP